MDAENAFALVGNFGKFQVLITGINFLSNILFGSQMLIMVIVGATPNTDIPSEANLTTIVTEWDLYDDQWVIDLMASLFMAGYIVGSVMFGQLPDLYGRKPVMIICFALATICSFCSAFCQNWHTFAMTRFLGGLFAGGAVAATFVLLCELIGKNMWASVGMFYQVFFSLGVMLLSVLGYFLQDWRNVIMVSTGLGFVVLPLFIFIVPESPRWLYSVGKIDKAENILKEIARKNGKDSSGIKLAKTDACVEMEMLRKYSILDLVRIKTLAIRLVISCYVWFACSLSYYGLTLDASDLTPNLYIAVILSGAVEIPAYVVTIIMMDRMWAGRNGTTMFLLLVSSFSSICILFISDKASAAKTVFGLVSKLTIAGAFSIMYVYVSELFPTQLRVVAIGASNIFARVGAIVAPFVPLLASTTSYLPYIVFGVVTLIAGALNLFMPETLGKSMTSMSEFRSHLSEHEHSNEGQEDDKEVLINSQTAKPEEV